MEKGKRDVVNDRKLSEEGKKKEGKRRTRNEKKQGRELMEIDCQGVLKRSLKEFLDQFLNKWFASERFASFETSQTLIILVQNKITSTIDYDSNMLALSLFYGHQITCVCV